MNSRWLCMRTFVLSLISVGVQWPAHAMYSRAQKVAEAFQDLGIEVDCNINGETDPTKIRAKLQQCTSEIVEHVATTETKRAESQQKNAAYMNLKTTVSDIVKNLENSKAMSVALKEDKEKVLAFLHEQAKKTEAAINNLHAAEIASEGQEDEGNEGIS
mmetsp:Transcript_84956/g.168647  ORF Transcript_84956/g.168647 Transcript_84956/m.168647 type:complete len:159 (+) Transcript_84956:101-577(+)